MLDRVYHGAKNVGLKGFKLGRVRRPNGETHEGLIITGKDGKSIGFSLALARTRFQNTSKNLVVVSGDGKRKIYITPGKLKEIQRLLGIL